MLAYLVKTLICSGLFYSLYHLLLRKETYFKLNRLYLLAGLLLAATLPLLHISVGIPTADKTFFHSLISGTKEIFFVYLLDEVTIYGTPSNPITWTKTLEAAYVIGVGVFFSLRIPIFLYQIIKLHRKSRKYNAGNTTLYVHNEPYAAFSFWNAIYVNSEELHEKEFKTIWKHEMQHIKFGHTIESFLLEIWCCIFWFNPFVWLTKEKLKEIHEFQTDAKLIQDGFDTIAYQKHLLNYTLGEIAFTAGNSFATSAIKRRIQMLSLRPSSWLRRAKFLLLFPILFLLLSAFTFDFSEQPTPPEIVTEKPLPPFSDTIPNLDEKNQ